MHRQHVTLTFSGCLKSDRDIDALSRGFPTGLKYTELFFDRTEISGIGIAFLSRGLAQCMSLRSIRLSLQHTSNLFDADEGLSSLGECFRRLLSLESVTISLRQSNINPVGLLAFAKCLEGHQQLSRLHLMCTAVESINDGTLAVLGASLGTLRGLTKLKLCFAGCPLVSDSGAIELCKGLKPLQHSLHKLDLYFVKTKASKGFYRCSATTLRRKHLW